MRNQSRRMLAIALVATALLSGTGGCTDGSRTNLSGTRSPGDDKESDDRKIQGTWIVISVEKEGKAIDEKHNHGGKTFIFDGDKTWGLSPDRKGEPDKRTFKLDPTQKPKTIDIIFSNDETKPGIYELDGDDLKLCFADGFKAGRPSEFKTKAGSKSGLMVLKREKK